MQHEVFVGRVARNHLAFDTARPFGVVAGDLAGVDRFVGGVGDALARLQRERRADGGRAFGQRVGELVQIDRALGRGQLAPALLRGGGGVDRGDGLGLGGARDVGNHGFGGRVGDGDELVACRVDKAAVSKIPIESHLVS